MVIIMTQEIVLQIFTGAIWLAFKLCAPMLLAAMLIGLVIAILQAATQVHEQTLTFAPKAIGITLALLALGPWMINQVIDYLNQTFERISQIGL
ncbi:MAG: flagellar biosynthesis protein FliQ [Oscillospiraceae bacterium]|nr:flagellar biosynthesis protein FliQ [Oscillospiraceae bacterium]